MNAEGWFVDIDNDEDTYTAAAPWQVVLQTAGLCAPLGGIWFPTKQDATDFMTEHVLGRGQLPD